MKQSFTTKKIALAGVLAALTCAGSAIRITIPLDLAGTTSFHLGNILCALSGILLGPWLGGLAAGLGSAIYDMFNPLYLPDCWMTFLMKFIYGMAAGLVIRCGHRETWGYVRALFAALAGAVSYAVLYLLKSYYYSGLLVKGLEPAAAMTAVVLKLPATIFNAVVAVIIAPVLAVAIRKALNRQHLEVK